MRKFGSGLKRILVEFMEGRGREKEKSNQKNLAQTSQSLKKRKPKLP